MTDDIQFIAYNNGYNDGYAGRAKSSDNSTYLKGWSDGVIARNNSTQFMEQQRKLDKRVDRIGWIIVVIVLALLVFVVQHYA